MKKNKKNIYEKKEKFLEDKLGIPEDMASFIRILLTVVISFTIVYVIVIILGNNGVFEEGYTKPEISESTISYEDILYSVKYLKTGKYKHWQNATKVIRYKILRRFLKHIIL